jgi:hypothetical protein
MAGNHHIAPVYTHPHIPARNEEGVTVMAVLTTELQIYTDPLAHRNPAGNIDITVTSFGMF